MNIPSLFVLFLFSSLQEAHHLGQCAYFQATQVCFDKDTSLYHKQYKCDETIDSLISGYCKCKDNWRTPILDCGHRPTTCESECKKCIGWRATMNCSPYSLRDPRGDLSCDKVVPSASAGYCVCEDGKRTAYSDCQHSPFTCYQECAKLPRRYCPLYNTTLVSTSATGCTGVMDLQNRANEEVHIFVVDSHGMDILLTSIPKGGSYKITKFCVPFSIRVYSSTERVLFFQQTVVKLSTFSFPITSCYGELSPIHNPSNSIIQSANVHFEMKWGHVQAVSEPLSEGTDQTFSILQPLASMLVEYNQSFTWKHTIECPHCHQKLKDASRTCPRCQGKGVETVDHSLLSVSQSTSSTCPLCGGYGVIPIDPHCSHCNDTHVVTEAVSESRLIPEGAPEGYRIVFEGKGNHLPFTRPSNVIYTLHYSVPLDYTLQNQDLVYDMKLTVKESREPHHYSIQTPLGREVSFDYPGEMREDGVVIEGEGLPILGHPVKCKQFTVVESFSTTDRRNRSCDEKIPLYLNGFCECDGRKVVLSHHGRGLINCYHPSLCGRLSRGNLIVRFSLRDVFVN